MNLPQHLNKCRRLVTIPAGDVQGDLAVVAAWQVSQPLHALETNVDFGSEPTPLESRAFGEESPVLAWSAGSHQSPCPSRFAGSWNLTMKALNPWHRTFARPSTSNSSETLHQSLQFMVGWGGERWVERLVSV